MKKTLFIFFILSFVISMTVANNTPVYGSTETLNELIKEATGITEYSQKLMKQTKEITEKSESLLSQILSLLKKMKEEVSSLGLSSCTDSDNGRSYYIKGTTTGFIDKEWVTRTDYCLKSGELKEFYCRGNNIVSVNYKCPYGCKDGACKRKKTGVDFKFLSARAYIMDSSSGAKAAEATLKFKVKTKGLTLSEFKAVEGGVTGTVSSVASGTVSSVVVNAYDANNNLIEAVSSRSITQYPPGPIKDGTEASVVVQMVVSGTNYKGLLKFKIDEIRFWETTSGSYEVYDDTKDWQTGYVNLSGATTTISCTDTDGGINYDVKGTVFYTDANGIKGNMTDTCTGYNNEYVIEYYCDTASGYNYKVSQYKCPYGCENGVCKKAPTNNWCEGADINRDGIVSGDDYSILVNQWGKRCSSDNNWCNRADVDKSGGVNILDWQFLKKYWYKKCSGPEPVGLEEQENFLANISAGVSKIIKQIQELLKNR